MLHWYLVKHHLKPHKVNVIDIVSADDMFEITSISEKFDVIIMSAAVADYRPKMLVILK